MTMRNFYEAYWKQGLSGWTPQNLQIAEDEETLIKKYVKPGTRVLEVGCGDGRIGALVTSMGAQYEGIDISEEALELARQQGLNVQLCDVSEGLPFALGSYDVVISFEVLEHLFRPDEVGRRIGGLLKKGGCFVGSVPNIAYFPNRITLCLGYFSAGGSPDTSLRAPWRDPHIRFFTPQTLRRMLEDECGFFEVRVFGSVFRPTNLPVLYRSPEIVQNVLNTVGRPLGFLGKLWPSCFGHRVYFRANS